MVTGILIIALLILAVWNEITLYKTRKVNRRILAYATLLQNQLKQSAPHINALQVARVEVIDEHGRSYVNWDDNNKVEVNYQDQNRTLKIFISKEL